MKNATLALCLALSLASTAAFADDPSDAETGVVCRAEAVSSKGNTFIYQLHSAGEILSDGSLDWDSDGLSFDVLLRKKGAARPGFLLKGTSPVHTNSGMGHAYYVVPVSALGLTLGVSHIGSSFEVRHWISVTEELVASGPCVMVD